MAADVPCPFCGELIKPVAKKCRFCGEFLEPGLTREAILEKRVAEQAAAMAAAPALVAEAVPAPVVAAPATVAPTEAAPAPAAAVVAEAVAAAAAEAAPDAAQAAASERTLAGLYQMVSQLPDSEEKAKLLENLKALEGKTDIDDESSVEEIVKNVAGLVPDVAEVAINTLINPASGVATLVQKVATRIAENQKK